MHTIYFILWWNLSVGSLMTLCACLYLFSCSAVLNPYTRIYDVVVLVIQCLQTSHTTLNSTESLLVSTAVVTPQILLAMHKAQTVSYRLYQVWDNEDNRHWNNSFLMSCRFLSVCRAWYCPHKAHRMPIKPLVQCAYTFIQFVRLLPGWLKYRVIHKSLRDFRTRLRNNQDRHGRKEHINR